VVQINAIAVVNIVVMKVVVFVHLSMVHVL
jgi:hypothetical protein